MEVSDDFKAGFAAGVITTVCVIFLIVASYSIGREHEEKKQSTKVSLVPAVHDTAQDG